MFRGKMLAFLKHAYDNHQLRFPGILAAFSKPGPFRAMLSTAAPSEMGMFSTLRQQFAPSLLSQVLQHVQLLVELLGSPADASFADLSQPFGPMAGVVDVPACTGRPAAVQRFQPIHNPGQIFDDGQITPG